MGIAGGAAASRSRPRARTAYIATTAAAGAAVLGVAALNAGSLPFAVVALFCAAAALSERFQVDADVALDASPSRFSFSSGIHLAAVAVAGPWVGAIAAAFGVVFVDRLRSSPWNRVVFNAAVFVLATGAGAVAWTLAGGEFGRFDLPSDFVPFAAMALTYAVVNDVLVAIVFALSSGGPLVGTIRETIRSDWATDATEAALGALLAFIVLTEPWATVVLAPLALAAYQAHARLALVRSETARALETFANVVDERDPSTFRHSARVASYVEELGAALHLRDAEVARLRWAGRLHDLGKVAVDAAVLRRPGKLDEDEWATMRRHPRLSARILRRFHLAADQARAVEFHHERFDGAGYYGVAGRELPLASHFLIVADSFDAMTSERSYRRPLPRDQALAEIEACAGKQFHPLVARAFVAHQRGEDPRSVLTLAERAELARSFGPPSLLRRADGWSIPGAETTILAGGTAALAGIGFALWPIALLGAATAFAGTIWIRLEARRGRRLIEALDGLTSLDAVARQLARSTHLSWAGVVRWDQDALAGTLDARWDEAELGPSEPALTSWLVRESDLGAEVLLTNGEDLGVTGQVVAVPLLRGGEVAGFFVLSFSRRLPRHVAAVLPTLSAALHKSLLASRPEQRLLRAAS